MCGLCGFILGNKNAISDKKTILSTMTSVLTHRGPDSTGQYYTDTGKMIVGLGYFDCLVGITRTIEKSCLCNNSCWDFDFRTSVSVFPAGSSNHLAPLQGGCAP